MIDDLDKSLEQLLTTALPASIAAQVTISFVAPDNEFPPPTVSLPSIDLFLYDVRENTDLRSNEWDVRRRSNGTATRQAPSVRVDCSYMVTAWPSGSSPTPPQDEHRLLSEVMRVLLAYPTLPASTLQGALQAQEPPLPTSSLQPGRLQSVGEFWQALGGKPKAALNYTVTVGVEAAPPVETGPVVTDKRLRFHTGTGAP
jgi:hypothetical protein